MCANNPIGIADLMVASHHGLPISNSEALVHAVRPRVIIVNNAIRKGASPEAMKTYFSSPGIEDVWQSHFSLLGGQEYTVPGIFIANGIDQPMSAIPVEPMAPPAPGANLPPAYTQRAGVLDQGFGELRRDVHGNQSTQWFCQDLSCTETWHELAQGKRM